MIPLLLTVGVGAVAALALRIATRPGTFHVDRSTTVMAPPESIFPFLEDFHRWSAWSPFEKLDPAMQRTFSGAERGRGAIYEWSGNKKAGKGRMEIINSSPPNRMTLKLDFMKPFESHNTCDFTLRQRGGGTEVTWAMHGPNTLMSKVMQTFIDMDKLVGKDFEAGLANLKAVAEG